MTPEDQYALLVDALRLVAASPEQQVSSLPDFVCVTDEVSSMYLDAHLLVPQLEGAALVPAQAVAAINLLAAHFEAMPDEVPLVDAERAGSHPFWADARALATESLRLLGEERRPPTFAGVTWVKG
jgi:hypothetical protein